MNGFDKKRIAIIAFLVILIIFAVLSRKDDKMNVSVPHDYHILYDDANKMIIVPSEYHFTTDSKGVTILTK